jgi:hypothetical protein
VAEKTDASVVPFDTVKQDVLRRLAQQRQSEDYETWIASLRENAVVDYRVREVGLQLDVPTESGLLDDARELAAPGPAAPPSPDDEISTSGSEAPSRGRPGAPADDEFSVSGPERPTLSRPEPPPEPTPTPTPPPRR